MIRIPNSVNKKLSFLIGSPVDISNKPVLIYDENRLDFLSDLSKSILEDLDIRQYPDIVTFGFWCRRSNLTNIAKDKIIKHLQLGLGLVYHNSPSNVPVNFAFSLVFGLLSGNSNIVRLSSKESVTAEIIVKKLLKLLQETPCKKSNTCL